MVVTYAVDEGLTQHEVAARVAVAKGLAALTGFEFGGGSDSSLRRSEQSSLYFVPSETLSRDEGVRLGIRGADDLFGGVRNYDVLSGPEVAALEAFRADAGLRAVRACSTEALAGLLVEYTIVEPHGTAH